MDLELKNNINREFGNKIRLRVCGILISNNKILLIKHKGLGKVNEFWLPPGGEVEINETIIEALYREFYEETRLHIKNQRFGFVKEFIEKPLHAIELYFFINEYFGNETLGSDPELMDKQSISELRWLSLKDLIELNQDTLPEFLKNLNSFNDLNTISNFGK